MHARIVLIEGHPDSSPKRLCKALADAYADGAREGRHDVRRVDVGALDFPLLRSKQEFDSGPVPESVRAGQEALLWANHVVILYPLWLGGMPALLKGYLEQLFRPSFAADRGEAGRNWRPRLKGRGARIVVTMGMPALVYRWYFGAHSLKSLERNILKFAGIGPIRESLFGMVEAASEAKRAKWLAAMRRLGRDAL